MMSPADRRSDASCVMRHAFWLVLAGIILAEGVIAVWYRDNDFEWHRSVGEDFLAGTPYRQPTNGYPLGRTVFDAGISLINNRASRGVCYIAALASLIGTTWIWGKLIHPDAVHASLAVRSLWH